MILPFFSEIIEVTENVERRFKCAFKEHNLKTSF